MILPSAAARCRITTSWQLYAEAFRPVADSTPIHSVSQQCLFLKAWCTSVAVRWEPVEPYGCLGASAPTFRAGSGQMCRRA
eukprot:8132874-Alexandrium_andersonii.AAC.1